MDEPQELLDIIARLKGYSFVESDKLAREYRAELENRKKLAHLSFIYLGHTKLSPITVSLLKDKFGQETPAMRKLKRIYRYLKARLSERSTHAALLGFVVYAFGTDMGNAIMNGIVVVLTLAGVLFEERKPYA